MGIEVVGVAKSFGPVVAVRELSLHAQPGELLAVVGPSGCGKTTLLRVMAGLEQADTGRVVIAGRDATHLPPDKRNVGFVFQQFALFPNMNVAENIGYGLRRRRVARPERERRVAELLAMIGMEGYERRRPGQLSAGQQQRVALARALAPEPRTLLLDEPLSALDAAIRYQLRDELRRVQRRVGITTIMVTHDQEEALAIADRVAVMNEGRLEQVGTPWDLYDQPRTQFVARFIGRGNFLHGQQRADGIYLPGLGLWPNTTAAATGNASGAGSASGPATGSAGGTAPTLGTAPTPGAAPTLGTAPAPGTAPTPRTAPESAPGTEPGFASKPATADQTASATVPARSPAAGADADRAGTGTVSDGSPVTVLVRPESLLITGDSSGAASDARSGLRRASYRESDAHGAGLDNAFVVTAIVREISFGGERAHVHLQPLQSALPALIAAISSSEVPQLAARTGEEVAVVIPHAALRPLPR